MKTFVIFFLLSTLNISYGEPLDSETVWFFTNLQISKCEARVNETTCSARITSGENTPIVLDNCFFQNEIETCSGLSEIEYEQDGIPFSGVIQIEKRTEKTNAPIYSMAVNVGVPRSSGAAPGYVTITLGEGGTLTNSFHVTGDTFWKDDKNFYIPALAIGPVKPDLNE